MLPIISGDRGSKGYVKGLFTYVSYDGNIKSTITNIDRNLPSERITKINRNLKSGDTFLKESNTINTTTTQLGSLKNDLSQFRGYIGHYTMRIPGFLIPPLSRLITKETESTVNSVRNNNGNAIKDKYNIIISYVSSLKIPYNISLETRFKNFRNELEKNKSSLEDSIKGYIERINTSLTRHSSDVQKFITSICDNIRKFDKNYSEIHKSRDYIESHKLMKAKEPNSENFRVSSDDFSKISNISRSMISYRNDSGTFDRNKRRLSTTQLKHYSTQFVNKTVTYEQNKSGSTIIDPVLNPLQGFKAYVDRFISNMKWVKKLEEIGTHIKTMKNELKQLDAKVDEKAAEYIEQLKPITINKSDVETIKKIKSVNESIIARLNIAKSSIEFYNSLQLEISKLNKTDGVQFENHDISQISKNYEEIQKKVESFECKIKSKLDNVTKEIEKFKQQIQKAAKDAVTCDGKTLGKQVGDDLISTILAGINGSLECIKSFIDISLNYIGMIEFILDVLQYNKDQSAKINEIKSKVDGTKGVSSANKSIKFFYMICITCYEFLK